MQKSILCLILSWGATAVAADFLRPAHYYPVVSRTSGLAGTEWSTGVQISNPQAEELVVTARISFEGATHEEDLIVPAGATRGWDDFLGEVFDIEGNAALLLEATPENNGSRPDECRGFAASVRIYTAADGGGSFGQGVPSLDPVSGFIGDWIAFIPGVQIGGTPGAGGFRTNVGFWHLGEEDAEIRMRLIDSAGWMVWERTVTAERHVPVVMPVPRDLDVSSGTLVVDGLGEWVDCAVYISVVDNITGDAVFLTPKIMSPEAAADCGLAVPGGFEGPAAAGPPEGDRAVRLRTLFLGER